MFPKVFYTSNVRVMNTIIMILCFKTMKLNVGVELSLIGKPLYKLLEHTVHHLLH
ncbi:hypothetical protein Lalb_Chr15g0082381 [Lupinus albus]|uniref:Uncharacterized protein n=1 Tax=Lupinus albus TaxID=3870 RepID=A0A6A4PDL4_LUPAL|nr:hypothetical protein Lalb_Chr15g0082381 [Lupinus albus]